MTIAISDSELSRLLIFQGVNPEHIRPWIDECNIELVAEGTVLLQPGVANDTVFVFLNGTATVHLESLNNDSIATILAGECAGELSVFDFKGPSAYVITNQESSILSIPRSILLHMIDHSNGFSRNLLFLLASRLRSGNETVQHSQQLQKEYEQHAKVDVLTGLFNRRWLNDFFDRIFNREVSDSFCPTLSVLMVDIDNFKGFNDKHGHVAGDQALKSVAVAMTDNIRPGDSIARYGGEEFLIILPNTPAETAHIAAQRILTGVEQQPITHQDIEYPLLTVSIGVAQLRISDTFESFIEAADEALYRAKNEGKNRYLLAERESPTPPPRAAQS